MKNVIHLTAGFVLLIESVSFASTFEDLSKNLENRIKLYQTLCTKTQVSTVTPYFRQVKNSEGTTLQCPFEREAIEKDLRKLKRKSEVFKLEVVKKLGVVCENCSANALNLADPNPDLKKKLNQIKLTLGNGESTCNVDEERKGLAAVQNLVNSDLTRQFLNTTYTKLDGLEGFDRSLPKKGKTDPINTYYSLSQKYVNSEEKACPIDPPSESVCGPTITPSNALPTVGQNASVSFQRSTTGNWVNAQVQGVIDSGRKATLKWDEVQENGSVKNWNKAVPVPNLRSKLSVKSGAIQRGDEVLIPTSGNPALAMVYGFNGDWVKLKLVAPDKNGTTQDCWKHISEIKDNFVVTDTEGKAKADVQLVNIINEVIDTERSFNQELTRFVETPFTVDGVTSTLRMHLKSKNLIPDEDADLLFSQIAQIKFVSDRLLNKILPYHSKNKSGKSIEESIQTLVKSLEFRTNNNSFSWYFSNFDKMRILMEKIEKNPEGKKIFDTFAGAGNGVNSALISPVQRPPRYELFAKELNKNYKTASANPTQDELKTRRWITDFLKEIADAGQQANANTNQYQTPGLELKILKTIKRESLSPAALQRLTRLQNTKT